MNCWACDSPWDAEAKFNLRLVMSEEQIVAAYADGVHSDRDLLDNWVIVNWAFPTDMPPGEYVTRIR